MHGPLNVKNQTARFSVKTLFTDPKCQLFLQLQKTKQILRHITMSAFWYEMQNFQMIYFTNIKRLILK
jgi:hypothetical protein